ncbi:MAG: GAF domain-containing protein [Polyangiaceae bacterium]|nr:GAF domain-containing protein [Polyangiaceae bacterium]
MDTEALRRYCDTEPVHFIGAIQPHGVLLALNSVTLVVERVSLNAQQQLQRELNEIIGVPVSALVTADTYSRLQRRVLEGLGDAIRHLGVDRFGTDKDFDILLHQCGDVVLLEAELAQGRNLIALEFAEQLHESLVRCEKAQSIQCLAETVVADVRRLTGYDRVMVYRFAEDGAGHVISEAMGDNLQLESFLDLHYPATDIPEPARRVMLLKRSRVIVDVDAPASPVCPATNAATGALDLTYAELRAAAPVHLEYLRNMGVTASLTLSIVVSGRLWGLIACHHYSGSRRLSYDARLACEVLSRTVSLHVERQLKRRELEIKEQATSTRLLLVEALKGETKDPLQALLNGGEKLAEYVDSTGFAIVGSHPGSWGECPEPALLRRFVSWLNAQNVLDVWATDCVGEAGFQGAEDVTAIASGLLALPLTDTGTEWLIWFRAEQVRAVKWAGRPDEAYTVDPETQRISPRKSFAEWSENVRGRSVAWDPEELHSVRRLRQAFVEITYRRLRQLDRLNDRLRQVNQELDAFAHVASHDLKAPLRTMRYCAQWVLEDHGEHLPDEGKQRLFQLLSISDRMHGLLDSLVAFSESGRRVMHLEEVAIADVVREAKEELGAAIIASNAEVQLDVQLPLVYGDRTMLREVFQNLISNALKYTDASGPLIQIGVLPSSGLSPTIYVKDNGIGIPKERLKDVFTVFRRLHPDGAYQGGRGIGLAIAQNLVSRHGGRIWVESTPGEGTTFLFTLSGGSGDSATGDFDAQADSES